MPTWVVVQLLRDNTQRMQLPFGCRLECALRLARCAAETEMHAGLCRGRISKFLRLRMGCSFARMEKELGFGLELAAVLAVAGCSITWLHDVTRWQCLCQSAWCDGSLEQFV